MHFITANITLLWILPSQKKAQNFWNSILGTDSNTSNVC